MSKIQIICASPGMRRHGVVHPASAIYEEGLFSEAELEAFRADPAFTVLNVADGGVVADGGDIEAAVAARVAVIAEGLQASFSKAVEDKVAETIEAAKAEAVKDVEAQLTAANGKVAALAAALDEAKAKAAPKK